MDVDDALRMIAGRRSALRSQQGRLSRRCFLLIALALGAFPAAVFGEDADVAGIDQIVVTITKRASSIQEVPSAISAFSTEDIRNANIEDLVDLVALVPNTISKGDNFTAPTIRGVSESFTGASPVAHHINGVFRRIFRGSYYDVKAIEVARGPAGTVYGRNATAGAINVRWNAPEANWSGELETTVGSYDLYQARGFANIPVLGEGDERLMLRLTAEYKVRDEYFDVREQVQSRGGEDLLAGRIQVRSVLSEDLTIDLRGFWSQSDADPRLSHPLLDENGNHPVAIFGQLGGHPFDPYDGYAQFTQALVNDPVQWGPIATVALGLNPSLGTREAAIQSVLINGFPALGVPPIMPNAVFNRPVGDYRSQEVGASAWTNFGTPEVEAKGFDLSIDYGMRGLPLLGDVRLNVLGGWEKLKHDQITDIDGTELAIVDALNLVRSQNSTGEVRLSSDSGGSFEWIVGGFYFRSRTESFGGFLSAFFGDESFLGFSGTSEAIAAFAHVTARPVEWVDPGTEIDLELFGGFRQNKDKTSEVPFRESTWDVGLRWVPFGHHTLWVKYAKGYKPGIVEFRTRVTNVVSGTTVLEEALIDEELVRAWEIGWKGVLWDGRMNASLTAFRYSYTDLQVPVLLNGVIATENAAGATINGVEFETLVKPNDAWLISFSAGWLDATFDEFCHDDALDYTSALLNDPACPIRDSSPAPGFQISPSGRTFNLAGNHLEDAPEFQVALLASYRIDLGEWGSVTPIVRATWTDDYFTRPTNRDDFDRIDSHTRTDVRVRWESADERFSAEIYAENLEDEINYLRTIAVEFPPTAAGISISQPRVYGVRMWYRWGE